MPTPLYMVEKRCWHEMQVGQMETAWPVLAESGLPSSPAMLLGSIRHGRPAGPQMLCLVFMRAGLGVTQPLCIKLSWNEKTLRLQLGQGPDCGPIAAVILSPLQQDMGKVIAPDPSPKEERRHHHCTRPLPPMLLK